MTEQLTFNLMPDRKTWTVSELTGKIRDLLAKNFTDVSVQGEVSNCREAQSGHIYFTLKDDRAQVRCVYFKQQQRGIKFRPEDGLQVTVRGSISVYEQRGEYQIYVEKIDLVGQGALQLAFEQLKKRLEAEGLFDAARKKPLPLLPSRIGIITSPKGAAVRDVARILTRRFPNVHLMVFPVRVQGEGAAEEIVKALKFFNKAKLVDVLILARRGFRRPLDLLRQQRQRADEMTSRLALGLRARLEQARKRFTAAHLRIASFDFRVKIAAFRLRLEKRTAELGVRIERQLRAKRERWQRLALQLQERGPLKVLERGYAIATDASGNLLRDAAQVALGDSVAIQLHRGRLSAEVKRKD